MRSCIVFTLSLWCLTSVASPTGPDFVHPDGEPEPLSRLLDKADQSQRELSLRLHKFSKQLDTFFGSSRIDEEALSESRIRINLISNFRDYSGDTYAANIRTRIALPNTEKRLNLVMQNFSRSFRDDREGDKQTVGESLGKDIYTAGLRYLPEVPQEWNLGADTGIKLVIPPDPYVRLRVRRTWWPEFWEIRATATTFWFNSQGFGHTEALEFDREISDSLLFRSENTASWLRSDDKYVFDQSLNFIQKINDNWAFLYFLRMTGNNDPAPHAEEYSAGANFRRRIKSNWFFFNIQPVGNWPRTENFSFIASINFKVEMIVGE